jgi:hypothetical protein
MNKQIIFSLAKKLILEFWRDVSIFALSFALFAHVYWLFDTTNKWWGYAWDFTWIIAYIIAIAFIIFKSNLLEEERRRSN